MRFGFMLLLSALAQAAFLGTDTSCRVRDDVAGTVLAATSGPGSCFARGPNLVQPDFFARSMAEASASGGESGGGTFALADALGTGYSSPEGQVQFHSAESSARAEVRYNGIVLGPPRMGLLYVMGAATYAGGAGVGRSSIQFRYRDLNLSLDVTCHDCGDGFEREAVPVILGGKVSFTLLTEVFALSSDFDTQSGTGNANLGFRLEALDGSPVRISEIPEPSSLALTSVPLALALATRRWNRSRRRAVSAGGPYHRSPRRRCCIPGDKAVI